MLPTSAMRSGAIDRRLGRTCLALAASAVIAIGCGGPGGTSGPAATTGSGTTAGPGAATGGPGATPPGPGGAAGEGTATLTLESADIAGSWELRGGRSVAPTDTLAAAIFTETVDDVAAGHGDLITITLSGTLESGSRPTSAAGITLSVGYSRIDAAGADIFVHLWASSDGSCEITMAPSSTGWAGSFTCASITDPEGHTVRATGTFNT